MAADNVSLAMGCIADAVSASPVDVAHYPSALNGFRKGHEIRKGLSVSLG
jgi:hypothetical protein